MTGAGDGLDALAASQRAIRARCRHPGGRLADFPRADLDGTLPGRFARQAARHAGRSAVETRTHALTYRALHRRAAGVAQVLRRRFGGAPEAVAVLLGQGAPSIWSALGTMAAGKICVPLDPAHPVARTAFILQDSGARTVLTDRAHAAAAAEAGCAPILVDEVDDAEPNGEGWDDGGAAAADLPAYLLYTSGSTGHPKGVVRTHRGLLHFQMHYANALQICADDRLSSLRSMAVFGGVRDVYAALLNGAALCALDVRREGVTALPAWLAEREITIAFFAASLFRHLADLLPVGDNFPRLRAIRLGSDTVQKADVELYRRRFAPSCILVNGLGSTETSTLCKYFIDRDTGIATPTVPVGYPHPDVRVFVLAPDGREVPPGEAGEIAVRSPYLADAYWRRPDLTAAAFRPSPAGAGERLFLTGNLGRQHPDGCVEHLGRVDFQVQIRGHRVELAEIERAVMSLPGVREAVVLAQPSPAGAARLVAYLVPSAEAVPSVSVLRAALEARVPDHMVPAEFVVLAAMPLNATSKVDRTALPRPGRTRPALDTAFAPAQTPMEEALAGIWREVLGLDRVGIHDAFLELGGDSLLASRIVARVVDACATGLPVSALLETSTVAAMALVVLAHDVE
ncbi:MAG TPA: non-ribosomal peptide synthetase, partial [Planctomycetota bacterium]|nr:non-ribosomal peptide synthetase [Planctomycetota bacterium]